MAPRKYGDDFKVGDVYRTPRLTVTETHVVNWAGLTGDFYPLHMDAVYAAGTQFGERLAHGPLIFGLAVGLVALAGFGEDSVIAWLGTDKLRKRAPVRIGDTITARVEVLELLAEKNRVRLKTTCSNQDGVTVLTGEGLVSPPKASKT